MKNNIQSIGTNLPTVVHILPGLDVGGAEAVLHKLIQNMGDGRYSNEVVSMTTVGAMGVLMRESGIHVTALNMRRGNFNPKFIYRLARLLRERKASLVVTWIYHADILGGMAAQLAGRIPVIWNIRQCETNETEKLLSKMLGRIVAPLCSYWLPDRIICCAEQAKVSHSSYGYARNKMTVIQNGFELGKFRPDSERRNAMRMQYGIADDELLVGMLARIHPVKNHRLFIQAAARVVARLPKARFILFGKGADGAQINAWREEAGLARDKLICVDARYDAENIYPGLEVCALSSLSEGFPNTLGEAMACEVPCVTTDVGDARIIVGEYGQVVPSGNIEAMASAMEYLLTLPKEKRAVLGAAARESIERRFSMPQFVHQYEDFFTEVIANHHSVRGNH